METLLIPLCKCFLRGDQTSKAMMYKNGWMKNTEVGPWEWLWEGPIQLSSFDSLTHISNYWEHSLMYQLLVQCIYSFLKKSTPNSWRLVPNCHLNCPFNRSSHHSIRPVNSAWYGIWWDQWLPWSCTLVTFLELKKWWKSIFLGKLIIRLSIREGPSDP